MLHTFRFFEGMKIETGCAALFLGGGVARGPGLGLSRFLGSAAATERLATALVAGLEFVGSGWPAVTSLDRCIIGAARCRVIGGFGVDLGGGGVALDCGEVALDVGDMARDGCEVVVAALGARNGGEVAKDGCEFVVDDCGAGGGGGGEVAEGAFAAPPVRARSLSSLFFCSALDVSFSAFC